MEKINKEHAILALNEGFILIFGEKYRKFIEDVSHKIVDLGIKNGSIYNNKLILIPEFCGSIFDSIDDYTTKITKENLSKELSLYFNDSEISKMKKGFEMGHSSSYKDGLDQYKNLIKTTLSVDDVNCVTPPSFDYFKNIIIYKDDVFSLSLYGESGLSLDFYEKEELEFYSDDNELSYSIENVALKYHYLGFLLSKQNKLNDLNLKIKKNLTNSTYYPLSELLKIAIYTLAHNEYDADEIILDIQKHNNLTAHRFRTHGQISEYIKTINI